MVVCPYCGEEWVVKSGKKNGKQRYMCKSCGKHFIVDVQRKRRGRKDLMFTGQYELVDGYVVVVDSEGEEITIPLADVDRLIAILEEVKQTDYYKAYKTLVQ